jgi:hypothetical protein
MIHHAYCPLLPRPTVGLANPPCVCGYGHPQPVESRAKLIGAVLRARSTSSAFLPAGSCCPVSQLCKVPGPTPNDSASFRCDRPSIWRKATRRSDRREYRPRILAVPLSHLPVNMARESLLTALRLSFSSGSRYCRVVSRSLCPISFWTVTISHPHSRSFVA